MPTMIRPSFSPRGARGSEDDGRIALWAYLSALEGIEDFKGGTYLDGSGAKRFERKLSTASLTLKNNMNKTKIQLKHSLKNLNFFNMSVITRSRVEKGPMCLKLSFPDKDSFKRKQASVAVSRTIAPIWFLHKIMPSMAGPNTSTYSPSEPQNLETSFDLRNIFTW